MIDISTFTLAVRHLTKISDQVGERTLQGPHASALSQSGG
jgi:hypothetical protein